MGELIAGAVGGIGSTIGGVVGNLASAGDRDKANSAIEQAMAEIQGIGAPPDMAQAILLKHFEQQGILTPEMEQKIDVAFKQIKAPTEGRDAQSAALKQLTGLSKTGLNAEDRLAFMQAAQNADRENSARQASVIQNMAARGQSGGGAELAARLQGAQSASNQLSDQSMQQAATASARALQALTAMGNLGGQLQGQDADMASRNANIANEQQRFNVNNQLAQQQRNVGARNSAQVMNLGEKQRVSDANANLDNADSARKLQGQMQTYNAKADQAQRVAGMLTGQVAPNARANADATAGLWQNVFGGAGQAASALLKKKSGGSNDDNSSSGSGGYPSLGVDTSMPAMGFAHGGMVPGQPVKPGDDPENDIVNVQLSPGEVVLPRSVAQDPEMAKKFIKHLLRK